MENDDEDDENEETPIHEKPISSQDPLEMTQSQSQNGETQKCQTQKSITRKNSVQQRNQELELKQTQTQVSQREKQEKQINKITELEQKFKKLEKQLNKMIITTQKNKEEIEELKTKDKKKHNKENKITKVNKEKEKDSYADKIKKYIPAAEMDVDGNSILQDSNRMERDPLGYTTVRNKKYYKEQKQTLTDTLNEKVTHEHEIEKFVQENKENPNLKTKQPKQMSPDERDRKIVEMFKRSSLYVGVAPISREHSDRVTRNLEQRGIINKNATYEEKLQITTKSLIKSWTKKYLKMNDQDWNQIEIDEITTTVNSNIVFYKM